MHVHASRFGWVVLLAACGGDPPHVDPPPRAAVADAAPIAIASADAPDAAKGDAAIADAAPPPETVFSAKPFETCPSDIDPKSVKWLPASVLPADQRTTEGKKKGSKVAVRVALAKMKTGEELLAVVGPNHDSMSDDDSDCRNRIDVYQRKFWAPLGTSTLARVDGGEGPALHAYYATGDSQFAAMLVATDEHSEPRAIRLVAGAAGASSIDVFTGGASLRFTYVEQGQANDGTMSDHLVALLPEGLTELLSLPVGYRTTTPCNDQKPDAGLCTLGPPGGFTVVTRGDKPKIRELAATSDDCTSPIANLKGCTCDATTAVYDPATKKFVTQGAATKTHVGPKRAKLP